MAWLGRYVLIVPSYLDTYITYPYENHYTEFFIFKTQSEKKTLLHRPHSRIKSLSQIPISTPKPI